MSAVPISLRITFKGEAPGIAEHRLSIGSLAIPLLQLLKATRRIASDIIRDSGQYASTRGRYAKEARAIDLQIESLSNACIEMNLVASVDEPSGFQKGLFPQEMLLRTMSNLLEAIKAESSGQESNRTVRTFLQMLPPSIQSQDYRLYRNGTLVKELEFSKVSLPEISSLPPFLDIVMGTVSGISFDPGPSEIWIKTEQGALLRCTSRPELIDSALSLRSVPIEALLVRGAEKPRLLWLKPKGEWQPANHEQKMEYLFNRWSAVLERLAQ
jgi:hypothetical protein